MKVCDKCIAYSLYSIAYSLYSVLKSRLYYIVSCIANFEEWFRVSCLVEHYKSSDQRKIWAIFLGPAVKQVQIMIL